MIGIVRDTWRAVLVVVVAVLLRGVFAEQPAPPPTVATHMPPVWQPAPAPAWVTPPEPQRPLRRVGSAFVELADSVIGVVR